MTLALQVLIVVSSGNSAQVKIRWAE